MIEGEDICKYALVQVITALTQSKTGAVYIKQSWCNNIRLLMLGCLLALSPHRHSEPLGQK